MRQLPARIHARTIVWLVALRSGTRGATAAEYALLISFIAVAIVAAVAIFGGQLRSFFLSTSSQFPTATN